MANSVNPDQTAPIVAVCSGFTLFASILNWSVMLGNYLQQTTFSDAYFSWRFKGYDCQVNIVQNKTKTHKKILSSFLYIFA